MLYPETIKSRFPLLFDVVVCGRRKGFKTVDDCFDDFINFVYADEEICGSTMSEIVDDLIEQYNGYFDATEDDSVENFKDE